MFCFIPFGGEQNGKKGQETEMEKRYLNMLVYVLEINSSLEFLKDCTEVKLLFGDFRMLRLVYLLKMILREDGP